MTPVETIHLVDAEELTRELLREFDKQLPRQLPAGTGAWLRDLAPNGWQGAQEFGSGAAAGRLEYKIFSDTQIEIRLIDRNWAPVWDTRLRAAEPEPKPCSVCGRAMPCQ